MSLVMGIDSSTQSTKVEVRDVVSGELVATARSAHPPTNPPVSEQSPGAWWDALVDAVQQIGDYRRQVVALSVAGQQHGLVLIDGSDQVIRPAKLWNDTTSAPNATALVDGSSPMTWAEATGSVPVASFTISKLAWIAEHEPESLARTAKVMLPHDYLTWRLTGRHVTDRGDASGTGWFDPTANRYRPDMLEGVVVDADSWISRLPEVLGPDEVADRLTAEAAAALGLPPTVMVGSGTGDNMAAALGLGLAPGDVAMSLGTSGTIYAVSRTGTHDESGAVAGFADASGGFLPLVCTLNSTKVTDAVAHWLGTDPAGLSQLAMDADLGNGTPILVPYFDGERTPNLPDASGSLVGLRTSTTRAQVALAAHDGVLCGLLDGLDALAGAGVDVSGRLHLIGGGARSLTYRQRCADLRGDSIVVPHDDETVATGSALQAASIATGRLHGEVARAWRLGDGEIIEPRADGMGPATREAYSAATTI